ncbi:DUF3857 domain-containing protein [Sediminitomix flava]|uniref:Uncharacterized protein DUF3857 n=1 Tax=Sediminitomix flava TaxID=379075 RepID=A0A315ZXY6_SEDFL|nr:DUF3857 domain-containing protein [Sediminitomix flava]PWJ42197.1 uncharacterized protein DUF3857 [Sediminitomix flava]
MKYFLVLFFIAILPLSSIAQDSASIELDTLEVETDSTESEYHFWGNITDAHLNMKVAPIDSASHSVMLYDIGSYNFYYSSRPVLFKRKRIVKILKEDGINDYGVIEIPFQSYTDRVYNYDAAIIRQEDDSVIINTVPAENFVIEEGYDGWASLKIAFTKLQIGDIIIWNYWKSSDNPIYIEPWEFQNEIPTLSSRISVSRIHPNLKFNYYIRGEALADKYTGGDFSLFELNDLPPMKDEAFVSNPKDYKDVIYFQLSGIEIPGYKKRGFMRSWDDLSKSFYSRDEVKSFHKGRKYKNDLELIPYSSDSLVYLQNIRNYVIEHFEWDGKEGLYPKLSHKQLDKKKIANSATINLYLHGLLKEAGFDVSLFLISTRSNGQFSTKTPLLTQFNYLLCYLNLDNQVLLLDATTKELPYDILPMECWVGNGLKLGKKEGESEMISGLKTSKNYRSRSLVNISFDSLLNMNVSRKVSYSGFEAMLVREILNQEGEKKFKELYMPSDIEDDSIAIQNNDDPSKDLLIDMSYFKEREDGVYFDISQFFEIQENDFKQETRYLPIEISHDQRIYQVINIEVPDNYSLSSIPKPVKLVIPGRLGSFQYNVVERNYNMEGEMKNVISINIVYNLKEIIIQKDYYQYYKEFHIQLLAKLKEPLIFTKNEM